MINGLHDPISGVRFSIQQATPLDRERIMLAIIKYLLTKIDPQEKARMEPEFEIPPHFARPEPP